MFCKKCGAEHPDGTRFCSICGTNMADGNTYDPRYGQSQQNQYGQNQYQYQNQQNQYGQGMNQNPYDQYNYNFVPAVMPGRNMAIASLVLGIVSLIMFAVIAGPLGIIFGCVSKSKGYTGAMATAGIVCGIIGVVAWILMLVICPDMFLFGY